MNLELEVFLTGIAIGSKFIDILKENGYTDEQVVEISALYSKAISITAEKVANKAKGQNHEEEQQQRTEA